jgi:short-subunit dehydrogenase
MKLDGCNALITGASAGIGREFARQLANRARSVVLIARRSERLVELRDELLNRNPNLDVHVRAVDLANRTDMESLLASLTRDKIDVDLLINNAGLGDSGPFANSDPVRDEQMILVNIVALTLLTRLLVPHMIERRHGGILNVSSCAGFLPIPGDGVYAATKAYVTSFSEALRAELRETGVSVCALCPGPVVTEFQDVARRPGARATIGAKFLIVSVERVVRDALAALEADRPVVIPGAAMKFAMFVSRLIPMPVLRLLFHFVSTRG